MGKIDRAVFDAGPFIHLLEIEGVSLFGLFNSIQTTEEIVNECKPKLLQFPNVTLTFLSGQSKDFAKYLIEQHSLDMGEATTLALCRQEKIKLFFTDDLEARHVANSLGFEAHGSISIILRAFRENIISKQEAKEKVNQLYTQSSLFLTKNLVNWILKEIDSYNE